MSFFNYIDAHIGKTTDKWSFYVHEYARLFKGYREKAICLLEIGVQNGGSLEVWSKYFKQARFLVGCDIDEGCRDLIYEDERVNVVVGDACASAVRDQILNISPSYDLIIDDGSHTSSDIVRSFSLYFGALSEGGLYVIEDLHCSYWQDYEGGLYNALSSIQFFKSLCDIVNHQSWGLPLSRRDLLKDFSSQYGAEFSEDLLSQVHSVEFLNSICVIRKTAAESNTLGPRIVRGREALVDVGPLRFDGQELVAPLQSLHALAAPPKAEPVVIDEDFYLRSNPDVAAAGLGAIQHYLTHGKAEGRHPTADRAVLSAVQEAKACLAKQAEFFAGLPGVVAENCGALAQNIDASQKQLELWHIQHAARFNHLAQASVECEERQVQRLNNLRADLSGELVELVTAQGVALAAAMEEIQKKLHCAQTENAEQFAALLIGQVAQAAQTMQAQSELVERFDLMAKSIAKQEASEVQRLDSLWTDLYRLKADLSAELSGLGVAQDASLAVAVDATKIRLNSGQAELAGQLAAVLSAQAVQAEQTQRQLESLQGQLKAFKAEFVQVNADYLEAKKADEVRVAALSAELEAERARLAWRAAHPFKALWRDLFSSKPAGANT